MTVTDDDTSSVLGTGTATIQDDGDAGSGTAGVSVGSVSEIESLGTISFEVTLDVVPTSNVTVDFSTADGSATDGSDYTAASGTLTFLAGGGQSQMVMISLINDTDVESDETFTLNLTNPSAGLTISTGTGTGTISNDDSPPTLSISGGSAYEYYLGGFPGYGSVTFTVTLSASSSSTVTVDYSTSDGTATAPSDYTAASGTVTFSPGTVSQDIVVTLIDDADAEPGADETFVVTL